MIIFPRTLGHSCSVRPGIWGQNQSTRSDIWNYAQGSLHALGDSLIFWETVEGTRRSLLFMRGCQYAISTTHFPSRRIY